MTPKGIGRPPATTLNTIAHWRARCRIESEGGCWTWAQSVGRKHGRPQARINKRTVQPHRECWELVNGKLPEGNRGRRLVLIPVCDNRRCINPAHHELKTWKGLFTDLSKRGQLKRPAAFLVTDKARAPAMHVSKIRSIDTAREIRRAANTGADRGELASRYGCTRSAINRVVNGTTWREPTPWAL